MGSSGSGEAPRVVRVRGRYELIMNGGPITNEYGVAVSYGRREDAEQMAGYWLEHGCWIGHSIPGTKVTPLAAYRERSGGDGQQR